MRDDGLVVMMKRLRGANVWAEELSPIMSATGTLVTDAVLHQVTPAFIF